MTFPNKKLAKSSAAESLSAETSKGGGTILSTLKIPGIIQWLIKHCHIQDEKSNAMISSDRITTLP